MRVLLVTALLGLTAVRGQIGATNCSHIDGWANGDLATSLRPVFDYSASGFLTKDKITVAWDQPIEPKFVFLNATLSSFDAAVNEVVSAPVQAPDDVEIFDPLELHSKNCYERRTLEVDWRHVVNGNNVHVSSNDTHLVYNAILIIWNFENLTPLRGVDNNRYVKESFPFQIVFPRTVASSFNPTGFDSVNLLAAIILQQTDVDLSSVDSALGTFDATVNVRVITSVQYPFRLKTGPFYGANLKSSHFRFESSSAGVTDPMITKVAMEIADHDCDDPTNVPSPNAGNQNPAVNADFQCVQLWTITFTPGSKDEPCSDPQNPFACNVCEIDGQYSLLFEPECHTGFTAGGENCPTTQDDEGTPVTPFEVLLTIDSEDFCPKVVEQIELTATLGVYKNSQHTLTASNFVFGQTMYFKAVIGDTPASIARSIVKLIRVDWTDGAPGFNYYSNPTPFGAPPVNPFVTNAASPKVVDTDDDRQSAAPGDGTCDGVVDCAANEVHFQWVLNEEVFSGVAADSSRDIDVTVTIEIEFVGVPRNSLLEVGLTLARRAQVAKVEDVQLKALPAAPTSPNPSESDRETSGASFHAAVVACVVAVAAAARLA